MREPEVSGPITGVALTSLWRLLSSGILGKLLWNVVCWVFATAVAFAAPITDALMLPGQASSADGHTTAAAGLACRCTRMDASSMEHLAGAGPACVVVHALPVAVCLVCHSRYHLFVLYCRPELARGAGGSECDRGGHHAVQV